jgi:hypothetical protein
MAAKQMCVAWEVGEFSHTAANRLQAHEQTAATATLRELTAAAALRHEAIAAASTPEHLPFPSAANCRHTSRPQQ